MSTDDLVTEVMVNAAFEAWYGVHHKGDWRGAIEAALRAVAPMIAARAVGGTGVPLASHKAHESHE
jgi:hypothetical protein